MGCYKGYAHQQIDQPSKISQKTNQKTQNRAEGSPTALFCVSYLIRIPIPPFG